MRRVVLTLRHVVPLSIKKHLSDRFRGAWQLGHS